MFWFTATVPTHTSRGEVGYVLHGGRTQHEAALRNGRRCKPKLLIRKVWIKAGVVGVFALPESEGSGKSFMVRCQKEIAWRLSVSKSVIACIPPRSPERSTAHYQGAL